MYNTNMTREYKIFDGIEKRKCGSCEKWLPPSRFYKRKKSPGGLRKECIDCFSSSRKVYYKNNKDAVQKRIQRYYLDNKDSISKYKSEWQRENSEKRRVHLNERYKNEPNFRIAVNLRTRVLKAIGNNQKAGSTLEILGCSIDFFKDYIKSMFVGEMSWSNHGEMWHIDHIKPCAKFDLSDESQQRVCFHYTNMQPLFVADNLFKGAR